jgi:hypothetical protein
MTSNNDFEQTSKGYRESSFISELWALLRHQKKYWLAPIIIVLLAFGVLVLLSGTAVAPFIYTLF